MLLAFMRLHCTDVNGYTIQYSMRMNVENILYLRCYKDYDGSNAAVRFCLGGVMSMFSGSVDVCVCSERLTVNVVKAYKFNMELTKRFPTIANFVGSRSFGSMK